MKYWFVAASLLITPGSTLAVTIYESADLVGPGTFDSGYTLSIHQFLGTTFELSRTTEITAVGGHLSGSSGGCTSPAGCPEDAFFAAIVELDGLTDRPDFFPSDILGEALSFTRFTAPIYSGDVSVSLSVTLASGYYGLIIGAGPEEVRTPLGLVAGAIVGGQDALPGTYNFRSTGIDDARWFEAPADMRFFVEGLPLCNDREVPPLGDGIPPRCTPPGAVPLPSTLPLALGGIIGIGWFTRRRIG